MPYEVSFVRTGLVVPDESIYINECCWGGDVIRDELLPLVVADYEDVKTHQEDWGWFIWFRRGPIHLAIDIMCDDPKAGEFRIRLTSTRKKLIRYATVDVPELEAIKDLVLSQLHLRAASVDAQHVDE